MDGQVHMTALAKVLRLRGLGVVKGQKRPGCLQRAGREGCF